MAYGKGYGKKSGNSSEITMEIKEEIGKVGEKLRLNLISWNGAEAKYDLRNWYTDKEGNLKFGKGMTFTTDELRELRDLIDTP